MSARETTREGTRSRLVPLAAALGLVVLLAVLAQLRRDHGTLNDVYRVGNLLDTHQASEMSLGTFFLSLGHLELAAIASLVVLFGAQFARRARATMMAFVATVSVIYCDSLTRWSVMVGGRLYVMPCDDALISMRYARNFAEGRGLVYNAGEAVDGYTNPLWTAVMVIPHALKLHEGLTALPVLLLAGTLLLSAALLARSLLATFEVPPALQWLAAFAVVFDASSWEHTIDGLEAPLVTFSMMLAVWAYFRERPKLLALGLVMLTLTRADGMVVALLLLAWMVIERRATSGRGIVATVRDSAWWFGVVLGTGIALMVWRYALYGHPLPNTYYLKVYSLSKRLTGGVASYGVRGLFMYGLPAMYVLLNGGNDDRGRAARRLLIAVSAVWLYSMYVGGDVFSFMRFMGPVTPLLWMAVAMTVSKDWSLWSRGTMATALVVFLMAVPVKSEVGVLGSSWDRGEQIEQWLVAAKSIQRNVPPGATVGTMYAGLPYFDPTHAFIDQLGKTESHIAHETEIHGVIPGHNKFDFPYIYNERKPDVTMTAMGCDDIEHFTKESRNAQLQHLVEINRNPTFYMAPMEQAADPTFQALYLRNRVVLREKGKGAGHTAGCWFVRDGSATPLVWELARY